MTICFLYVSCGSILPPPPNFHTPPPRSEGNGNSEAGGVQKEAISQGGEGLLTEVFSRGSE